MNELVQRIREAVGGVLAGMSPAARVGLLLLAGTLAFMVSWTISQSVGPSERSLNLSREPADVRKQAADTLTAKQIKYVLREGEIFVAPADYERAAIELAGAGVLSGAKAYEWLKSTRLGATTWENVKMWQISVQQDLVRILRKIDTIEDADVLYSPPGPGYVALGNPADRARATVNVRPRTGREIGTETAIAIASIVAGAVPQLKREDVLIVDSRNSRSVPVPGDGEQLYAGLYLQQLERKVAEFYQETIRALFMRSIPGLGVVVNVKLNGDAREEFNQMADEDKTFTVTKLDEMVNLQRTQPSADPSLQSKGQLTVNLGAGTSEIKDERRRENIPQSTFRTKRNTWHVGNDIERISVAMLVPQEIGGDKMTDQQRADLVTAVKDLATGAVKIVDASKLEVVARALPTFAAIVDPVPTSIWDRVGEHLAANLTGYLSLILALIGLWLVYKLVRAAMEPKELREMKQTVASAAAETPEFAQLQEAELMADQLRGQIRDLVQKNPRAVAGVLKRWMTQS